MLAAAVGAALFLFVPSTASATVLPGKITENMTLTAAGSPYTGGTVTIEPEATVTAQPGVTVKVNQLVVKGTLKGEGTAESPVLFTAENPKAGEWQNIVFESGSGASSLNYVEVAYGGFWANTGAIEVKYSSPTITNSTIRSSNAYGIKVFGGGPNIGNNQILNSVSMGIVYSTEDATSQAINFHGNVLEGNGGSAAVYVPTMATTVATSLGGNTVTKNTSTQAIYYTGGGEVPPDIGNNSVSGNTGGASSNQVYFSGTLAKSGTWESPTASLYVGSTLKVASGATLTVKPGVTIHGGSVEVLGTLKAEGEAGKPVVFEPRSASEYCGTISFLSGSGASVLNYVETYRCANSTNSGAIEVKNSSPTITNSTIRNSRYYGIKVFGGAPDIGSNQILGSSTIGVIYSTEGAETQGVNFHGNLLEGNGGSATVYVSTIAGTTAGTSLGGNTVTKNSSTQAIYYTGGGAVPPDIASNMVSGNTGGASTNQVYFSGPLAKSGTWEAPTAPLYIGTLKVPSGVTLTVKPGVTIHGGSIEVLGTLKAEGEAGKPVALEPTTEAGYCGTVSFLAGSGESVLNYVETYRCGNSTNSGAIEVKNSSPAITSSTIRNSRYYGIKVFGGAPNIGGSKILGSSTIGIIYSIEGAETQGINFHDNVLEGNGGSAAVYVDTMASTVATSLGNNTLTKNSSTQAIYYVGGNEIPPDIADNTVSGNTGGASTNQVYFSGILAKSATWESPTAPLYVGWKFKIASGATLTVKPGVTIHGGLVEVLGTLKAEGEATKPVVFEPRSASEYCGTISLMAGSGASVLDGVETYRCGTETSSGAIEVKGSSPTITNSTIRGSRGYGIKVIESGAPTIKWNRFRSNPNGLSYSGTGNLLASYNDWGCASGPKPAGCGDSVTSNVSWKPAVQLPEMNAQCRGPESQCGEGADPVSLATGQLSYSHRDLLLTNKSDVPLEFVRAYSSGSGADSGLGPSWSQTGLASATELESGEVLIVRQDGRQDLFQKTETGYKAPSGVTDTLAKVEGTFQLTTLEGTVYRFDSSGRIASITDDHGLKTTYGYNAEGRLATITDPSAQTLTFSYNASNHITSVKDSTGREVKFTYSAAGDLATVTDALGGVTEYGYDSQHRITSIKDPRGNVILKNTYDSQGRIVEQRDGLENLWKLEYKEGETIVTEPEGGKIAYGFDSQKRVVSETDQLGNKTTTAYDAAGNVAEVVKPGSAKWLYGHDAAGNLTSVTDPKEGKRSYEYDAQNRLTNFTDARGSKWSYEWSEANNLTKVTDPEEGETTLTYNESGQPLTVTDDNGHKTEFSYDTRGNPLSVTDPLEHKTSFEYDARNHLIAKTAPGLKAESFERNSLGDLLARTTPLGNKTKYAYDANGMPTQITDPAENIWKIAYNAMERPITYTDPLEQQTTVAYNGNLKPTKVTDRRGKETTYVYDLANRLTKVTRPEAGIWSFGYDARGNRTSVVDPRENTTTYVYDLLDRMTKANEPLEVSSEYGYDANGGLTSVKDPRANTTTYTYDKLGRLTKVAQPLEKTTSLAYDGVGNLLSRTTAADTLGYAYDAADRLEKVSTGETTLRSLGHDNADRLTVATDAQGKKIEIAYNEDGRVASINDGRGQSLTRSYNSRGYLTKQVDGRGTLEYGYDKLGRLTSLIDPQGKTGTFAYDAEGGLTEAKRPGGIVTTNVFDNAGRLSETTTKVGEPATTLDAFKYGYDPAGNVVSRTDTRLEQETKFAYDALGRLTEFNPPGEGTTTYGYDAAGNRTAAAGTTYTYNALNQLTESSDGTTYSYDGAGRMIAKVKEGKETTYKWDLFDHLASLEGPAGTASYAYDALDRLSERTSGGSTQVVHYGDLTDLPTYDANGEGETTTSYVSGARGLLEQRTGGATSFPLRDAHGDITAIASEAGAVASRQAYDPWGSQLSGPAVEMGYLGAQQRRADPLTGLIQMGARSYTPALGRFTTEDPVHGHLGAGISLDRYAYAWDNPLNLYDLDGRDVCVPTPFGDACAEDAAEDVGNAAGDAANAAWNWTEPGRSWMGDRASDFWKAVSSSLTINCGTVADFYSGMSFFTAGAAISTAPFTSGAGTAAFGSLAVTSKALSAIFRSASDDGAC